MNSLSSFRRGILGLTLTDLLVSTAISSVIALGMFTAISSLQRCAAASNHFAQSQLQQSRILDYIALDLRRAQTVSVDTLKDGSKRLNLAIPDYYDAGGNARDAVIQNGGIAYGSSNVLISYYKVDGAVYRSAGGTQTELATDVEQFIINFTDSGKQTIGVSISFVPRFQFSSTGAASVRDGTAAYATTLLRNKRIQ